jgi:hypothetical protein
MSFARDPLPFDPQPGRLGYHPSADQEYVRSGQPSHSPTVRAQYALPPQLAGAGWLGSMHPLPTLDLGTVQALSNQTSVSCTHSVGGGVVGTGWPRLANSLFDGHQQGHSPGDEA